MLSKDLELKQHKINAYIMPVCLGKRRKIVTECSNWEIYYNGEYCESIAKPCSGAANSVYGNLNYIYRQIRTGVIKKSQLTKYGARLLKSKGYRI